MLKSCVLLGSLGFIRLQILAKRGTVMVGMYIYRVDQKQISDYIIIVTHTLYVV